MSKIEINNFERFEMLEDKFGIKIEGLYAFYEQLDTDFRTVTVNGEIHAKYGTH